MQLNRLDRYKQILAEFGIDPDGEDAHEHVSGALALERYCLVTAGGGLHYAQAIWDNLESAKAFSMSNIDDDIFPECPVAVIDLDTGERLEPDFRTIQWRAA